MRNDIGLKPDDAIVVGVSGGPDSMALLYIMNEFKNNMGLKLICAHINHNVRKESDQEKIDLENYCKKNNIVLFEIPYYSDLNEELIKLYEIIKIKNIEKEVIV